MKTELLTLFLFKSRFTDSTSYAITILDCSISVHQFAANTSVTLGFNRSKDYHAGFSFVLCASKHEFSCVSGQSIDDLVHSHSLVPLDLPYVVNLYRFEYNVNGLFCGSLCHRIGGERVYSKPKRLLTAPTAFKAGPAPWLVHSPYFGTPGRGRTDAGRCLRPMPLPLGYRGIIWINFLLYAMLFVAVMIHSSLERVKGIGPSSSDWKSVALPLSYTRN